MVDCVKKDYVTWTHLKNTGVVKVGCCKHIRLRLGENGEEICLHIGLRPMSLTLQWPLVNSNGSQKAQSGAADASNEKATRSHKRALQSRLTTSLHYSLRLS